MERTGTGICTMEPGIGMKSHKTTSSGGLIGMLQSGRAVMDGHGPTIGVIGISTG